MDKVAEDVMRQVQEGVRTRFKKSHDQNITVEWYSKQTLVLTAKRVSGDRKFTVVVKELPQ